jgi:S1-C subfamily serine protease
MRRLAVAALMIAVIALLAGALAGCGNVLERLGVRPTTPTSVEGPALGADAVVAMARPSVVKVRAGAPSCQIHEGTGFVVSPNKVLAMAHVVAGGQTVTVDVDGTEHDARVVSFDPNADISILDVHALPARPLGFSTTPAKVGTKVLVLGYSGPGPFAATPARIRELWNLEGPDIYRSTTVTRNVYKISGIAQLETRGLSGGPVIDMTGQVLGVVLGKNADDPDIGFVIAAAQLMPQLAALGNTDAVTTGPCIS